MRRSLFRAAPALPLLASAAPAVAAALDCGPPLPRAAEGAAEGQQQQQARLELPLLSRCRFAGGSRVLHR